MMLSIILIENRKDRLDRILGEDMKKSLLSFNSICIVDREDTFNTEQWDEYFFQFDLSKFDDFISYDILLIHKSKVSIDGHKNLDQFCRKFGKSIVYFSGGLTGITFVNDGYPCLSMNSSNFYSSRLINFLVNNETNKPNILEIAYGQKWQLSNLLKFKNLLHQLICTSELNIELKTEIEDLIPIIEETFDLSLIELFELEKNVELMEIINSIISQKVIRI